MLTSIITNSITYRFSYGAFSQRRNIKAGDWLLASYTYTDDQNRYLSTLDYGNGDSVEYTYDNQGRMISQTWEDGDVVTYQYDNSGALATVTDSATGRKTTYYYDFTDRLMKYAQRGESFFHSVGYAYDQLNNVTQLVEQLNDATLTTSYTYDQDNRVTALSTELSDGQASADVSTTICYDSFSRVATVDNGVVSRTYSYRLIGGNSEQSNESPKATGQVETLALGATGDYHKTYTYEYDANGNIVAITESSDPSREDDDITIEYSYDTSNQLLREDNQAVGKTWVWTYDNAGNILSKTEYDYTTGTPSDGKQTGTYAYDDSTWGDLLRNYGTAALKYDGIGNPTQIGTSRLSWEKGRQLHSLTQEVDLAVVKHPDDFVGRVGDTVRFSVEAKGEVLSYRWQVSNNGGGSWSNSSVDGFLTANMSVPLTEARHGWLYRCQITDKDGNVVYFRPGEIVVAPIVIDEQPENYYGNIGDQVSFSITARGDNLSYRWQVSNNGGKTWSNSSVDGFLTNSMSAPLTEARVGCLYRCQVTDGDGNVVYSEPGQICLDVLSVVTQPEDYIGRVGETVHFSIEARGDDLSYRWQSSNDGGETWSNSSVDGFNTNSMRAELTEARIGWLYRCQVTDGEGNTVYSEPGEMALVSETWTYTYDADGLRTGRSNGTKTYSYVYNGSSLVQMTVDNDTLYFLYDATSPTAVIFNGTTYYYATNLQGDIVAILDTNGNAVVEYTYDAWGNHLSVSGTMAGTLGEINPLRYRGYVYDTESTLYYLQSRYYDPEMGRFINADTLASTGQGVLGNNMYAYCLNNPVRYRDSFGVSAEEATDTDESDNEEKDPGTRVVGAGIQFDLDVGMSTAGYEIILFWDPTVCGEGNWKIAVYNYNGISVNADHPFIQAAIACLMANAEKFNLQNKEEAAHLK